MDSFADDGEVENVLAHVHSREDGAKRHFELPGVSDGAGLGQMETTARQPGVRDKSASQERLDVVV